VQNWDLFLALDWSLGPLCFGRNGGYNITNMLMTFFSRSSLSCTFGGKNTFESEQIGMGYTGTNDCYEEEYSPE
jgi:hypothetical protein